MMRIAFFTLFLFTAVAVAEPTRRDIKGTELLVQAELDELEAPLADVAYVPSASLAAMFPKYLFVGVHFPESSTADLPKPLQRSNIYAVGNDGIAKLLATPEDVLDFFKSAAQPAKTAEDVKKAVEAALALESAKYPNQPFSPQDVQVKPDGQGGFTGSGTSQPTAPPTGSPSGSGPISVTFNTGKSGQPTSLKTVNNYRPPARRNKPATAADIAADMPVAQKAAGGPVTNINSPTINKYLPGQTFFTAPNKGNKKANPAIVAVDPAGQPQLLPKYGPLFQYVHKNSDNKLTTAEAVRKMLTTFLTLATSMFPSYKFDPVQESDITITPVDGGGFQYKAMVYVTGDRKKWFGVSGRFRAKGGIGGHAFHDKTLAE